MFLAVIITKINYGTLYKSVEQGIYTIYNKQTGKMLLKSYRIIIERVAWYSLYAVIPFS